MRYSGNNIVVTGGAGFIGSHLCERLLSRGNRVVSVDNYITGSRENIAHLEGVGGFKAMEHDITSPLYLEADIIFNLACPGSPVSYQQNAIRTIKTSVLGSLNILGLAKRTGAVVVQASTSEVYGDPEVHPQPESYYGNVNPTGPRACYDEGKRCAETLFMSYHLQHGVDVKIARIFNTYGPGMMPGDGRVVSNFIIQALEGKDITLYGDGGQSRSFIYIDDMVEALIKLASTPYRYSGPLNIGNPEEITMKALAHKIISLTGSLSAITTHPLPADDPVRRRPDIGKAMRDLDWAPSTDIEEGLMRTIHYFRQME